MEVAPSYDLEQKLTMSKDILVNEMHSASIFESEEKLCRAKVIEALLNAKESCFQICFNKKVDESHVKEILEGATDEALAEPKKLSQAILTGKEVIMDCFLTNKERSLGRSRVISLEAPAGMNFRQVDHRSINWLVLHNVKYCVKK